MQPHPRVTGFLMRALAHELNAVQQYQTRATLAELWGDRALAEFFRHEVSEELRHAELITRHLLLLGVAPRNLVIDPVRPGRDPDEMRQLSAEHERRAIRLYDEARLFCQQVRDPQSYELFAYLLQEEMGHLQQMDAPGG